MTSSWSPYTMQQAFQDRFTEHTTSIDGSYEMAVKKAMSRSMAIKRSDAWERLESEITYLSKVDEPWM